MKKWLFLFLLLISVPVFAQNQKITEITEDTSPTSDDLTVTVNSPASSPANRKVTLSNLTKGLANASTTTKGVASFDSTYFTTSSGAVSLKSIPASGVNWTSIVNGELQSAGVNWVDVNAQEIQSSGINWSSAYADNIQPAAINWVALNDDIQSEGINWIDLESQAIQAGGINWSSAYSDQIQSEGINWTDLENDAITTAGINWTVMATPASVSCFFGLNSGATEGCYNSWDTVDTMKYINSTDNTKAYYLSAAGITAGQTRTITMPDRNADLGNLAAVNINWTSLNDHVPEEGINWADVKVNTGGNNWSDIFSLASVGGGSPSGSANEVQFKNGTAFGGDADLQYNSTSDRLILDAASMGINWTSGLLVNHTITDMNGDLWIASNAYDADTGAGVNWVQFDSSKPSTAMHLMGHNGFPGEPADSQGMAFWTADAGSGDIGTTYASNGSWELMFGSLYGNFVIGGQGFELDGNGTMPYGRVLHSPGYDTFLDGTIYTGIAYNVYGQLGSGLDSASYAGWFAGVETEAATDAFVWRRIPASTTLNKTNMPIFLKLHNTGVLETIYGLELENGTDPDVASEGEVSWDSDDDTLRGHDGTNQVVVGRKNKEITAAIVAPNSITGKDKLVLWKNLTGFVLNITKLFGSASASSTCSIQKIGSTGTGVNWSDIDEIEALSISTLETTDGINWYYGEVTSGINWTTVQANEYIGINWTSGSPDSVLLEIQGWLDANVN